MLRLLLCVALMFAVDVVSAADRAQSRGGQLDIVWNVDRLAEWGLKVAAAEQRLALDADDRLDIELVAATPAVLRGGAISLPARLGLSGTFGKMPRRLRIVPRDDDFEFDWVDARGRIWLVSDFGHQQPVRDGRVEIRHLSLRVGPQLARAVGIARFAGESIGEVRLLQQLDDYTRGKSSLTCGNIVWPGSGKYIDVALTELKAPNSSVVGLACEGACTADGSQPGVFLKFHPDAELRNVGTADVPWYAKFQISPFPYPYAQNDQHPMLVWALYRLNANGSIEQLARSEVKHAFFAQNSGCGCPGANILYTAQTEGGIGCGDLYNQSTNDSISFLAPRAEVIPSSGRWGRCGSFRDLDCNGVDDQNDDTTGNADGHDIRNAGSYVMRPRLAESDLVPANHPGAQYFIEAWYVVRDDVNIFNSMGHRRVVPTWVQINTSTGVWQLPFAADSGFVPGPVSHAWLAPGTTTPVATSREIATADGQMQLAVKVADLGGGQYRYDYALMNFDFTRPLTTGNEPSLRVLRNLGAGALHLPMPAAASATTSTHDGDMDAGNAWTATRVGEQLRFTAAAGTSQPWGALYRFSVTTDQAPKRGCVEIIPAEAGEPSVFVLTALVPGDNPACFSDGFED